MLFHLINIPFNHKPCRNYVSITTTKFVFIIHKGKAILINLRLKEYIGEKVAAFREYLKKSTLHLKRM